ncbi:uncharacterized protein LOC110069383 [Orbicella faveolata]|uniref:uncharacterized protein LOC110069383 n=1 Tax=Orbicella faveolata TaxID=48498 RepID=UPI0009E22D89|nr:uncharacterized protein LOC110069383 [Orbicella faveolata]
MVLKNIHKEKEEETLKVVIWCHLGHAYIKEVSEDDEEEDYFTLAEIKEKLEEEGSWKTSIFEGGLDDIEIERIEKHLESHAVKEDIRYDFKFITPSCRDVRVKVQFWYSFSSNSSNYKLNDKISLCQKPNKIILICNPLKLQKEKNLLKWDRGSCSKHTWHSCCR